MRDFCCRLHCLPDIEEDAAVVKNGREALIGDEDDGVWLAGRKTLLSTTADTLVWLAVTTDL
ncbi:hypothetical protein ACLOJK_036552 [Asimina triloba]